MNYQTILPATFLRRPNRFVAHCLLDGKEVVCHVKNTGRCRELLVPGYTVYLEYAPGPNRKTDYSLVAVDRDGLLINMDSYAPNRVFYEYLESRQSPLAPFRQYDSFRREVTFGDSRYDFALTTGNQTSFGEIKGVTLEENGVVRFPDAPTQRGVKHILGLCRAAEQGYGAHIVFVVQMEQAKYMEPNDKTHPEFGQALRKAAACGVDLHAFCCQVTPSSLSIHHEIPIHL